MNTNRYKLQQRFGFPLLPVALLLVVVAGLVVFRPARAVEPPPEMEHQTVETELEVQFGTNEPQSLCHNVTVYWKNGMVQRIVVEPCSDPAPPGSIQIDTDHPGWSKLISIPTVFRLRVPHVDAAAVFADGAWRPISSFPGGYAHIIGGFLGQNIVGVDGSGRVAYLQSNKIVQSRIHISAEFMLDLLPEAVDDFEEVDRDSVANEIDVTANDINDDGGPLTVIEVSVPAHGTATLGAPDLNGEVRTVLYTPDSGYCDNGDPPDEFTYTLNGGSTATVYVTVNCEEEECQQEQCFPCPSRCGLQPFRGTLLLPGAKPARWMESEWRTPNLSTSNLSLSMIASRSSG